MILKKVSFLNEICKIPQDDDDSDDDDDDGDDDDVEDNGYLELAYLIGNTTCRVDSLNTSCYSTYFFDVQYVWISEAFVSDFSILEITSQLATDCKQ